MKTLKSILIKGFAVLMLGALVTLNINVDSLSEMNWEMIGITVQTQAAHAECPACPGPGDLNMDLYECASGYLVERCMTSGGGCDVSGQGLCPGEQHK